MLAKITVRKGTKIVFTETYYDSPPTPQEAIEIVQQETGARSFELVYKGHRPRFFRWYPKPGGGEYPVDGVWKWGVKA